MYSPNLRVLLVEGEDGCLLVFRDAYDVADERESGAFSGVAMHERASIQPAEVEHHDWLGAKLGPTMT
jgi:hypothetical protein